MQKVPRRRKCKNHLVQLAEMYPDVSYHVAAAYGSAEDQIYVMEVRVDEKVVNIVYYFTGVFTIAVFDILLFERL